MFEASDMISPTVLLCVIIGLGTGVGGSNGILWAIQG